ncbi:MAG: membrane dipeptidase [Sphingobacteriales bacterium]|nr:membrane dipeptidase [Sphingobacteriales bacterium]MBI3718202.1 membrane dipeptidase [Sphingobacteriales bacterium]
MKKFFLVPAFILPLVLFGQSYKKLHNKAILVDTHNDIPSATIEKNVKFDSDLKGKTHSDLQRMKEGGIDVQIFSIFCGPEQATPYAFANREIDSVYEWTRRNPDKMIIVKNPEQLEQAIKEKKLAAMMGVEGGHMIENKIENLDKLYERGVRYMTLTWNNSTSWATSAADETTKKDSLPHKGLTDFGKQVVKRMNELGMIVDISHVGEQTFWDAINTTTKPIIASHSCVWNLCPHRRNLKDDQIKAIGKNGGVIHLNFYAGFIDSTYERKFNEFKVRYKQEIDELVANKAQPDYAAMIVAEKHKDETGSIRPPLSLLLDHLDYIVKMIGVDHVGMGSDFDGIEAPPRELNGVEDYPLITKALLERGYSKKDIKKMLGGNFLRVFKAVQSH